MKNICLLSILVALLGSTNAFSSICSEKFGKGIPIEWVSIYEAGQQKIEEIRLQADKTYQEHLVSSRQAIIEETEKDLVRLNERVLRLKQKKSSTENEISQTRESKRKIFQELAKLNSERKKLKSSVTWFMKNWGIPLSGNDLTFRRLSKDGWKFKSSYHEAKIQNSKLNKDLAKFIRLITDNNEEMKEAKEKLARIDELSHQAADNRKNQVLSGIDKQEKSIAEELSQQIMRWMLANVEAYKVATLMSERMNELACASGACLEQADKAIDLANVALEEIREAKWAEFRDQTDSLYQSDNALVKIAQALNTVSSTIEADEANRAKNNFNRAVEIYETRIQELNNMFERLKNNTFLKTDGLGQVDVNLFTSELIDFVFDVTAGQSSFADQWMGFINQLNLGLASYKIEELAAHVEDSAKKLRAIDQMLNEKLEELKASEKQMVEKKLQEILEILKN